MPGPSFDWKYNALQKRFAWSLGTTGATQLDYMGLHILPDAATTDPNWHILKYTWDGSEVSRIQGPLVGSWDDRAALGW